MTISEQFTLAVLAVWFIAVNVLGWQSDRFPREWDIQFDEAEA